MTDDDTTGEFAELQRLALLQGVNGRYSSSELRRRIDDPDGTRCPECGDPHDGESVLCGGCSPIPSPP